NPASGSRSEMPTRFRGAERRSITPTAGFRRWAAMSVRTDNYIVIDAPMEEVWRITNDVVNWPSLFTEYATAEILEQNADTVRFRLTMHPDEQGRSRSWVSDRPAAPRTGTGGAGRGGTGP